MNVKVTELKRKRGEIGGHFLLEGDTPDGHIEIMYHSNSKDITENLENSFHYDLEIKVDMTIPQNYDFDIELESFLDSIGIQ
jgi:hypothetical protein